MTNRVGRKLGSRCAGGLVLGLSLAVWAAAPPGRYTLTTVTVVDTRTMLTWQRTVSTSTYTWPNATAYCQGLNLLGTGWRLPTVKELQSLVDIRAVNPAIDTTAFPSTPVDYFWSSSPHVLDAGRVWAVSFNDGSAPNGGYNPAASARVRCVR